MKQNRFAAVSVLVLCAMISIEAHAVPKGIAILALDNQAELSEADTATLFQIVEAPFKSLPAGQYLVTTMNPVEDEERATCDEACTVQKAGTVGADYAVCTTVSTLSGRTMAMLKLYDTRTGRLLARQLTEPQDNLAGLVKTVDWAAQKLSDALPSSILASQPRRDPPPRSAPQAAPPLHSHNGVLHVNSDPPGASVEVGGRLGQRYIGVTPLTENLLPNRYRVVISKDGYADERHDVYIYPGKTRTIHVDLYSAKRLLTAGHFVFWPGIVALIPSAALASTNHRDGAIATAVISGTLITAGAALLITGAVRLRKEKKSRIRRRGSERQARARTAEGI